MGLRLVGLGLAVMGMAACGGASTGGGTTVSSGPVQTYASMFDDFIDTGEVAEAAAVTSQDVLASSGTARYEGQLFLGSRTVSTVVDAVVGDLALDFDLADNTFDGSATGFRGRNTPGVDLPTVRSGSLAITDGTLLRSSLGVLLQADVDGTLQFYNDTRDMDGTLSGTIKGDAGEYAFGTVNVGFAVDPITLSGSDVVIDRISTEGGFATVAQ